MRYIAMIGALLLAGCDREEVPRADANDQYQMGYTMGHSAGVMEEHVQLCTQIANYKADMATALRAEGICPKAP